MINKDDVETPFKSIKIIWINDKIVWKDIMLHLTDHFLRKESRGNCALESKVTCVSPPIFTKGIRGPPTSFRSISKAIPQEIEFL